jgi:hypothetical protein
LYAVPNVQGPAALRELLLLDVAVLLLEPPVPAPLLLDATVPPLLEPPELTLPPPDEPALIDEPVPVLPPDVSGPPAPLEPALSVLWFVAESPLVPGSPLVAEPAVGSPLDDVEAPAGSPAAVLPGEPPPPAPWLAPAPPPYASLLERVEGGPLSPPPEKLWKPRTSAHPAPVSADEANVQSATLDHRSIKTSRPPKARCLARRARSR